MNDKLTDDDDIHRQGYISYAQANMLSHRLDLCSDNLKLLIFKAHHCKLATYGPTTGHPA